MSKKNTRYVIEVFLPDPRKPPQFRTLYEWGEDGTVRCGDDMTQIAVYDTFEEADWTARYINSEFGYFAGVRKYEQEIHSPGPRD